MPPGDPVLYPRDAVMHLADSALPCRDSYLCTRGTWFSTWGLTWVVHPGNSAVYPKYRVPSPLQLGTRSYCPLATESELLPALAASCDPTGPQTPSERARLLLLDPSSALCKASSSFQIRRPRLGPAFHAEIESMNLTGFQPQSDNCVTREWRKGLFTHRDEAAMKRPWPGNLTS